MRPSIHRVFGIVATGVVLVTVVWGFTKAGAPDTRRAERMDERRLEDLQTIHGEILELVRDPDRPGALRAALPSTLAELASKATGRRISTTDPESNEAYEYRVTGTSTYVLCATFARPRDASDHVFWNHGAGRACFTLDALNPP
jgi:hypothetical protein